MKNLIAELLVKLAQKEEESKELVAQVEALEIVVTALLRQRWARWRRVNPRPTSRWRCNTSAA